MQLFVVYIFFTSVQKFDSSNLDHLGIYGISKPTDIFTGELTGKRKRKTAGPKSTGSGQRSAGPAQISAVDAREAAAV
jgi:hypothetical protein